PERESGRWLAVAGKSDRGGEQAAFHAILARAARVRPADRECPPLKCTLVEPDRLVVFCRGRAVSNRKRRSFIAKYEESLRGDRRNRKEQAQPGQRPGSQL